MGFFLLFRYIPTCYNMGDTPRGFHISGPEDHSICCILSYNIYIYICHSLAIVVQIHFLNINIQKAKYVYHLQCTFETIMFI